MNIWWENKIVRTICAVAAVIFFVLALWYIFIPSLGPEKETRYEIEKGMGYEEIAKALQQKEIIKSGRWFKAYVILSGNHSRLQAGVYDFSSTDSIAFVVKKLTTGETARHRLAIIEGWNLQDIASYLEAQKFCSAKEFLSAAQKDWSKEFVFLKDKSQSLNLEGYVFPDTYEVALGGKPDDFIRQALHNFEKKITPELQQEIVHQKKTIFEVVIMASLLEKEVSNQEDKETVSGILHKRLESGMALQVDATVNYITGKHDPKVALKDTSIDSPYNTYKYPGLPRGPIANPGIDSIKAALYPEKSEYWYYLSADGTGETIFSKTLDEHNAAIAKHFR